MSSGYGPAVARALQLDAQPDVNPTLESGEIHQVWDFGQAGWANPRYFSGTRNLSAASATATAKGATPNMTLFTGTFQPTINDWLIVTSWTARRATAPAGDDVVTMQPFALQAGVQHAFPTVLLAAGLVAVVGPTQVRWAIPPGIEFRVSAAGLVDDTVTVVVRGWTAARGEQVPE